MVDNPVSFRGAYPMGQLLPHLQAAGWQVDVFHRLPGRDFRAEVSRELGRGYDLVVGAGGDGTLRDLACVLAGRATALGVLPGGTTNLWARELGMAGPPELAARLLIDASRRPMDVGRLVAPDGRWARFLLMAGTGMDAAILAATHSGLKRRLGPLAVALGSLRAARAFRPFAVRITVDGEAAWEGRALQVIVGNARRYAAVLQVTPQACVNDGLLDMMIVPAADLRSAGRLVRSLLAHRRPRSGDVPLLRGREFVLETDQVPLVELDGGFIRPASLQTAGPGPFRFLAEKRALQAWVPRAYRGGLFSGT
jgi:diacylglycerol kinase (ATP)